MTSKRSTHDEADDGLPAKMLRISIPISDESEQHLSTMKPSDLDLYITTEGYKDGICDQTTLKLAEAGCVHRPVLPYAKYQIPIQKAMMKHFDTTSTFLLANEPYYHKLRNTTTFKAAADLLPLARHPLVEKRQDLQDAILYRVCFLVMDQAFEQNGRKNAERTFARLAGSGEGEVDKLLVQMCEATQRHLARPQDRSVLWAKPGSQPQHQPTATSSPTVPIALPPTASPPENLAAVSSSISKQHAIDAKAEIVQDDWVAKNATAYIKTAEELASRGVVAWQNIDSITESQKYDLEDEHETRADGWEEPIKGPAGILFHGVGGCGKTEIVRSWCVYVGAIYFKIELSIEGSYRGQTVR